MRLFARNQGKKTRGQTMVEFALVLPLLLVTMFGVMELGRLLVIYVTTTSAAREATRYASAVEETGDVARFQDCIGIRAAARRMDVLNAIQTININYYVDYGGTSTLIGSCPVEGAANQVGPDLNLGNQVVVEVIGNFQPIVPIVPININQIEAESARTVIKDVPVGILVPPLAPPQDFSVQPPWVYFELPYQFINETAGTAYIRVIANNPGFNIPYPVRIYYRVSGLSEAQGGGVDYTILDPSPITIPEDELNDTSDFTIDLPINDDLLFEYHERVILYIYAAKYIIGGVEVDDPAVNIISPYVHVVYILDDDRVEPVVFFEEAESYVDEGVGTGYKDIIVKLDKISGRDTTVDFSIDEFYLHYVDEYTTLPAAVPGYDYLTPVSSIIIPATVEEFYIRVPIFDNGLLDGDRAIKFNLLSAVNARLPNTFPYIDPPEYYTENVLIIEDDEVIEEMCNVSMTFNSATNTATITNSGRHPIYLTRIYVGWDRANRDLITLNFNGFTIWSGIDYYPDADIEFGSFNGNRRMGENETKYLIFGYNQLTPPPDINAITVEFDDDSDCSVSYSP